MVVGQSWMPYTAVRRLLKTNVAAFVPIPGKLYPIPMLTEPGSGG